MVEYPANGTVYFIVNFLMAFPVVVVMVAMFWLFDNVLDLVKGFMRSWY